MIALVWILPCLAALPSEDPQEGQADPAAAAKAPAEGREAKKAQEIPVIPPPEFMSRKQPMPDISLKNKKEGFYITGFPILGSSPDTGFSVGAAAQFYQNGPKDSPFFRYAPYRQKLSVGASTSTGGVTNLIASYDQPYVADSPYRFRSYGLLRLNEHERYFGVGDESLESLRYPGSSKTYDKLKDYDDDLDRVVDGRTWSRYDEYENNKAVFSGSVERDFLGGVLRPLFGVKIARIWVNDYTGEDLDGGIQEETHLAADDRKGRIRGFDGGWDNTLRLGLTFDTRDYEPDPTSGVVAQMMNLGSSEAFGSEFNYGQSTLNFRGYQSIFKKYARLVLAGNVLYTVKYGDVPFYAMPEITLPNEDFKSGLGGWDTLRGYMTNRFVGKAAAVVNLEVRWTFAEAILWGQHLKFMAAPFIDTGRAFEEIGDTTFMDWKLCGGVGFRLAWNLATVVSFDYGISSESNLFFMQLGFQF